MAESRKYEIEVAAVTQYLEEQSDPASGRYVFSYTITIRNTGTVAAQLISPIRPAAATCSPTRSPSATPAPSPRS